MTIKILIKKQGNTRVSLHQSLDSNYAPGSQNFTKGHSEIQNQYIYNWVNPFKTGYEIIGKLSNFDLTIEAIIWKNKSI